MKMKTRTRLMNHAISTASKPGKCMTAPGKREIKPVTPWVNPKSRVPRA
jgi:hypothetical protein